MHQKVKTKHVLMLRKLETLCDTAFKDFLNGKFETLAEYETDRKKAIKLITLEPGVPIINDNKAYSFFKQIHPQDTSKCGKLITALADESAGRYDAFDESEINELAIDWFYTWTSGDDYVRNLLEIGKLVLKADIPEDLHALVEETRRCYALDQYLAVCSLSRTILEAFLVHLCNKVGQPPEVDEHGHPKTSSLFEIASMGDKRTKKRLRRLYGVTSTRIHAGKTIGWKKAKSILQEVILLLQEIYDLHGYGTVNLP